MRRYIDQFIRGIHPIVDVFEKKKINQYASKSPDHQPIFIVGAPRTGSTILYQIVTNKIKTLYIDNLVDLWHRNFFFGFWLSYNRFNHRPHNCFTSRHGNTNHCGLRGPSECGRFWYRWLPTQKHFVDQKEVSENEVDELSKNIFSVINKYQLPLVFKNLNAGQRMRLIAEIAPNAKFIFVKRDPLYTAQSIFKAKQKVGLRPDEWWSVKPKNYNELLNLPCEEQIVKQIFFLEKQIIQDSKLFPEENLFTVQYETLMQNSEQTLDDIYKFIGNEYETRQGATSPELKFNEKQTISDKHFENFKVEISKLDWRHYEYEQTEI